MKVVIKAVLLAIMGCIAVTRIQAQDLEKDFDRMLAAYKDGESLYLEMENTVYKGTEKVKEVSSTILKSGSNYKYRTEEQQLLLNQDYVIFIDNRNYNIVVSDRNKAQENLQQKAMPVTKEVLKQYKEVVYQGESKGYKHYQLKNSTEQVVRIDLFFETKTGFIKRAIYHHNPSIVPDKMSTEIQLKVINLTPTISSTTFSEKNVLKVENKKLYPTSSYRKYSLHDNRISAQ